MSRIGILTFHQALNFGAILQAYALQKVLHRLGHQCECIDYVSPAIERIFPRHEIQRDQLEKFECFRNENMKISDATYFNAEELKAANNEYDTIIVGSDQVWNTNITQGESAYFLEFAKPGKKMFSYAASFGREIISQKYANRFQNMLERFSSISVREKSGCTIIEKLGFSGTKLVLDPTLLLDKRDWKFKSKHERLSNDPYILVYSHHLTPRLVHVIDTVRRELKLPVKFIGHHYFRNSDAAPFMNQEDSFLLCGPSEFSELFSNASFIATNSYHGMIFSIIFQKKFFATLFGDDPSQSSVNTRLLSLLETLGLSDRLVGTTRNLQEDFELDYENAKSLLKRERLKSFQYLIESLKD